MTPLLDRNSRFVSSRNATIGSATRSSTNTIAASSTTPIAIVASTSTECQPLTGPSDSPYISVPRPKPESRKPGRSNRPGEDSGTLSRNSSPKMNAAAPIGTLT